MDALEYLRLQLRLEGKDILRESLLRQVEFVPGEEMPLMAIVSLSSNELVAYYDEALAPELQERLEEQVHALNFPNVDSIIDVLKTLHPQM